MLWLRTGVLSDREIERFLGRKIFIWPFNKSNLKGSTYNLTASLIAISASDRKSLLNDNGEIVIPVGETALIQTDESIYVSEDICGTYHSKVRLVTQGLSHIGTTLDPCYFGTSLIAVHNHSGADKSIKVGSTFASLMLYKMPKSSKSRHDNQPFRNDLIDTSSLEFSQCKSEERKGKYRAKINEWYTECWRTNKEDLVDEVRRYIRKRDEKRLIGKIDFIAYALYLLFAVIIIYIAFERIPTEQASEYIGLLTLVTALILPLLQLLSKIIKEQLRGD